MVVTHLVLNILFAFVVAYHMEDRNIAIFMERVGGDWSGDNYVCIKLVGNELYIKIYN